MAVQANRAGTPVPGLSIEVDDVDRVYARATAAGCDIVYDLTEAAAAAGTRRAR